MMTHCWIVDRAPLLARPYHCAAERCGLAEEVVARPSGKADLRSFRSGRNSGSNHWGGIDREVGAVGRARLNLGTTKRAACRDKKEEAHANSAAHGTKSHPGQSRSDDP